MKNKKAINTRRIYILINTLFWTATALPIAFLVLFRQERSLSLGEIAITTGIYSLTILLLEIPSGALADRFGRKRITLWAYGLIAVTGIVNILAFSLGAFIFSGILYGAGRALVSGALEAWFIDTLKSSDPEMDIHPFVARAGVFELAGLAAGTAAGGAIATILSRTAGASWGNRLLHLPGFSRPLSEILSPYASVIGLSVILHLVTAIVLVILVKEEPRGADGAGRISGTIGLTVEAVKSSFRNPVLRPLLILAVISGIEVMGVETYWQPFFSGMPGITAQTASLFSFLMAGSFFAGVLGTGIAPAAVRIARGNHAAILVTAWLLKIAAAGGLMFQTRPLPGALFFLLSYFGATLGSPSASVLANTEIPDRFRASMLSVQSLFFFAGCLLGSAISGPFCEAFGIARYWGFLAIIQICAFPFYILLGRGIARSSLLKQEVSNDK